MAEKVQVVVGKEVAVTEGKSKSKVLVDGGL